MAKKKSRKKAVAKASSKKRKVSHAGARQKGLQFERDVANAIGHIYPEAKRHLESQASECAGYDISGAGPYRIQCKNHQNYTSIKTIKEVDRTEGTRPVLITKGNKMEPVVVMYFCDWIKMLEEIKGRELHDAEPKLQQADALRYMDGHDVAQLRGWHRQINPPKFLDREDLEMKSGLAWDAQNGVEYCEGCEWDTRLCKCKQVIEPSVNDFL